MEDSFEPRWWPVLKSWIEVDFKFWIEVQRERRLSVEVEVEEEVTTCLNRAG